MPSDSFRSIRWICVTYEDFNNSEKDINPLEVWPSREEALAAGVMSVACLLIWRKKRKAAGEK